MLAMAWSIVEVVPLLSHSYLPETPFLGEAFPASMTSANNDSWHCNDVPLDKSDKSPLSLHLLCQS